MGRPVRTPQRPRERGPAVKRGTASVSHAEARPGCHHLRDASVKVRATVVVLLDEASCTDAACALPCGRPARLQARCQCAVLGSCNTVAALRDEERPLRRF